MCHAGHHKDKKFEDANILAKAHSMHNILLVDAVCASHR